jgi:prevent-host-death family protein
MLHSRPVDDLLDSGKAIMREISASEAQARLGTLLAWVANGEEVLITRRGVAVARLVPVGPCSDQEKAERAVEGLIEARRGVTLNGLKVKDLINEGRP